MRFEFPIEFESSEFLLLLEFEFRFPLRFERESSSHFLPRARFFAQSPLIDRPLSPSEIFAYEAIIDRANKLIVNADNPINLIINFRFVSPND